MDFANATALATTSPMTNQTTNLRTSDFDYFLPQELIASAPVSPRDSARLLHVESDGLSDHHVRDLSELLRADDFLVVNDTKVIPARLFGKRGEVNVEVFLNRKLRLGTWSALARPGKRLRVGDTIKFASNFSAEIIEKHEGGEIVVRFPISDEEFMPLLMRYGHTPLPPYIKRPEGDTEEDRARYQTMFARREGAVAAPTAGLHFTPELFEKFSAKGIEWEKVTLHVGAGTFLPVKAEKLSEHVMHAEWGDITEAAANKINEAKKAGRRIVSIGTTPLRLLETAAEDNGQLAPFSGETSIFIYPGYRFRAVDALITNFHLPKSSLFMLVSAFAGLKRMRSAYEHAIAERYRFYSFGDASLLEKHHD